MDKNLMSTSSATQAEFFTPEKITVRPGTIDLGKEYETKVTALLALRCYFQGLEHFWLASNADGCGALDDIVMFRKSKKADQGVTYFIQVKHQNANKPLVQDTGTFLSAKGDYSFKKYSKGYNEINKNSASNQTSDLLEHPNSEIEFIILTNRSVKRESDEERSTKEKYLSQINVTSLLDVIGSKGDIFKIEYETLAAEPDVNIEFLKKLYLVTNQPHCTDMNEEIKTIIKENMRSLRLSEMNLNDIVKKFVDFTDDWSKGHLGGHYPLTKMDISRKLAELVLLPHMFHLKEREEQGDENGEQNNEENEEENIWYHLTKDKDVTIIDEADEVVQQYLTSATYNIVANRQLLSSITKVNTHLLRVISNPKNMSNVEKYELLWQTTKIPLVLQVLDEEGVRQIQEILKQFPPVFRVIILNKTKTHLEKFQDLKAFTNLTDLNIEHQKLILKKPIQFQGKKLSSIEELNINQIEFLKSFKVKDIVHILRGQFNIGGKFGKLPEFFVEISVTRNILTLIKEVVQDIFVVKCKSLENFERFLIEKLGINSSEIIHWERISKNNLECRIIIFDFNQNVREVTEFLLTLNKTVHFLGWNEENNLELFYSLFKTLKESIFAKELLLNFYQNNQTLLISANPGMGKSVLMNYFALNVPTHLWVLKLNLAKYKNQYKHWDTENCNSQQLHFESFYKEVLKEQETMNSEISYFVFEQFLKSKNVVWLLDSYDEVPVNCQNGAKQLIKFIKQSGFSTCVTTRPVLENELELALNTFAVTLNMFTIDEQSEFLRNYYANIGNVLPLDNRVRLFVDKLLKAIKLNLNDIDNRFTGIPLQTTLLAEVFKNDFKNYLSEGIFKNQNFDLISLYEYFINEKIKIAFSKVESVSVEMIDQYKTCRSFYALLHLFAEQDLKELKIDDNLQVVKKMFQHTMQLIQKDGIVVADSQSNVTFVHQTYAEFLVAEWLAQNINTSHKEAVKKLIKRTFHPNFLVVRNMFDRILAKNYPLHTAIINRQTDRFKELIIALDESAFNKTDDGGRTILHLIASWGSHHPDSYIKLYKSDILHEVLKFAFNRIPNIKLMHVEDNIFNYTPFDYAILSRSLFMAEKLLIIVENPCYFININKEETDSILEYVKEYYFPSLYTVILKCFLRTDEIENETSHINKTISDGNLANVRSLISDNNVNTPDCKGCTPLHTAAKGGQKNIILFLLSMKAKVNKTDENGRSALHWASYLGHLDIISLLLSKGAKVNITDCYGLTPLHYALLSSSNNQANIVSLLIETKKGCSTVIRNVLNNVLKITIQKSNTITKIASLINLKDKYDMSALHLAAFLGQIEVLQLLLLQNVDINAKGWNGMTPLMFAVHNEHGDSANLLLTTGADMDARNSNNQTALHLAVVRSYHVVTVLLNHGADMEAINSDIQTPLHLAAYRNFQMAVTVLLIHGSDVKARDSEKRTPLHFAVIGGHLDVVIVLLRYDSDVKARDSEKRTPLHLAVIGGHLDVATVLLTHGSDVKARDSEKRTPLHFAVIGGHLDVVTVLLTHGSDVKERDSAYRTPLHLAAIGGHLDVVTALVTHGADVNSIDSENITPLHLAAARGHRDVIILLLTHSADMKAKDSDNKTLLHLAAFMGHLDVVTVLLPHGVDVNAIDFNNKTPLHLAAQEGRHDVVTILLTHGVDIKAIDSDYNTPLHLATYWGHQDVVTILLTHGADVNAIDSDNRTPLHLAAEKGHHDVVAILLTHGADTEAVDSENKAPLHFAALKGHLDVVTFLLTHGADTKAIDCHNRTPLHWAARAGHHDVVTVLLTHGADVKAIDFENLTPIHLAALKGHQDVLTVLLTHGADVKAIDSVNQTPLHLAAQEGHHDVLTVLLTHGADVKAIDSDYETSLHFAAYFGHQDLVNVLLINGSDIKATDFFNRTPLHLATQMGHQDVVIVLLINGSDIEATDFRNRTPLHLAALKGHFHVVTVLVTHGADVRAIDSDNKSPLHVAAQEGHPDIVTLLLAYGADL